jgi:hypothetical protein
MIKIFYGSDGRTVMAKAIKEFLHTEHIVFFPEITTTGRVGHSSMLRTLDISVPASEADMVQAIKELVALESDTKSTIIVATCSPFVLGFIQQECKECIVIKC